MVHPSIESQRAAIQELCRRFGVRRLELFGSAARDDFDERASDVDFVVEFQPGPVSTAPDRYFGLLHGLEDRLLRRVDLVMTSAVDNPYFLVAIERDRTLLYAA